MTHNRFQVRENRQRINRLNPNSDETLISLYIINTCSNIQVMRMQKVIAKDEVWWYLDKFSLLVS